MGELLLLLTALDVGHAVVALLLLAGLVDRHALLVKLGQLLLRETASLLPVEKLAVMLHLGMARSPIEVQGLVLLGLIEAEGLGLPVGLLLTGKVLEGEFCLASLGLQSLLAGDLLALEDRVAVLRCEAQTLCAWPSAKLPRETVWDLGGISCADSVARGV